MFAFYIIITIILLPTCFDNFSHVIGLVTENGGMQQRVLGVSDHVNLSTLGQQQIYNICDIKIATVSTNTVCQTEITAKTKQSLFFNKLD